MKKEWLLLLFSTVFTLFVALTLLRWFAPQLLSLPADLQMVRVGEQVAPFFDGVFRPEDYNNKEFIIRDPYIIRARPLYPDADDLGMGPNDILGFRNRAIPNVADLICIGDSQTYGNNVLLEQNWPNRLRARLADRFVRQYSMATGGWGPVEYLEIMKKALVFRPRVMVVAFYTGNDSLDGFRKAYSDERWAALRPNENLSASDLPPAVDFNATPPPEHLWAVKFPDGMETVFTPYLRLLSNDISGSHQAVVRAGYEIIARSAREMAKLTADADKILQRGEAQRTRLIFTIIPTKEFVYQDKVKAAGMPPNPLYEKLIKAENANIEQLAAALQQIAGADYVDISVFLRQAALQAHPLYPRGTNGHPLDGGYTAIAFALGGVVREALPLRPAIGLVTRGGKQWTALLNERMWFFDNEKTALANGWKIDSPLPELSYRDTANLPPGGVIHTVDPQRFGPPAVK